MRDRARPRARGFSTIAVHGGEDRQKYGDAITDPIFCASTYTFTSTQAVIDFIEQKQAREEYGRYGNPGEKGRRAEAGGAPKEERPHCCSRRACQRSSAC